jgi:hypothetical protein
LRRLTQKTAELNRAETVCATDNRRLVSLAILQQLVWLFLRLLRNLRNLRLLLE